MSIHRKKITNMNENSHRYKMNVILDLDSTIISSLSPEQLKHLKVDEKKYLSKLYYKSMKTGKYLDFKVYSRPHLKEFLLYLFKNFNISVFTAASLDYALFIVNEIIYANIPKEYRKLDFILHSDHVDISEKKYNKVPKALKMLWIDLKIPGYNRHNTILIDDLDETYYGNERGLVLRLKPFNVIEMKEDNFLLFLIKRLKKEYKMREENGLLD